MSKLYAMKVEKTDEGLAMTAVEQINAADIDEVDTRIFVVRESDIDWVSEALEAHLNNQYSGEIIA